MLGINSRSVLNLRKTCQIYRKGTSTCLAQTLERGLKFCWQIEFVALAPITFVGACLWCFECKCQVWIQKGVVTGCTPLYKLSSKHKYASVSCENRRVLRTFKYLPISSWKTFSYGTEPSLRRLSVHSVPQESNCNCPKAFQLFLYYTCFIFYSFSGL